MVKGSKASTIKSSKAAIPKSPKAATSMAKGVVILEKWPQNGVSNISPNKKSKTTDGSKGKETMPSPDAKKVMKPIMMARMEVKLGEGTSLNPGDVLGLNASMLENSTMAKKLLEGVVHLFDREEVRKLDLDRAISKLFYGIGQVIIFNLFKTAFVYFFSLVTKLTLSQVMMLTSSLVGRSKELRDEAMTQQAWDDSVETEMAWAQQHTTKFERQVAELRIREQQAADELDKLRKLKGE